VAVWAAEDLTVDVGMEVIAEDTPLPSVVASIAL
jgi:hypothetical protein